MICGFRTEPSLASIGKQEHITKNSRFRQPEQAENIGATTGTRQYANFVMVTFLI